MLEVAAVPQPVLRVDHDRVGRGFRGDLHHGGGAGVHPEHAERLIAREACTQAERTEGKHPALQTQNNAAARILYGRAGRGKAGGEAARWLAKSKDWVFELVCTGPAGRMGEAIAFANRAARGWVALPKLAALDLYAPVVGGAHDPFNDDGPGPLFIAMLAFPSRDALAAALGQSRADLEPRRPARQASPGPAPPSSGISIRSAARPRRSTAPFSYVVRYHKPAEDEAAFIRNYVDTHPPTLATLPGIRSVMCYFPQPLAAQGLAPADYIIGNEVAFDSVAAFNAAMQSPVRQELRRAFPRISAVLGAQHAFPDEPDAALVELTPLAPKLCGVVAERFSIDGLPRSCGHPSRILSFK